MNIELNHPSYTGTFYTKSGAGVPVLLLHGFGEDSRIWENQLTLEKYFTVIRPDLPGSGISKRVDGMKGMHDFADWVREILDQEGIEQIVLLGHSMGGYIGLAFAELFPERLLGFGLIHSSAFEDTEEKKLNREKSIKLIQNSGKEVFLKAMIPNLYAEESKKSISELVQNHLEMALSISSEALIQYYQAMIDRPDRREILKHTKVPVLFVVGTEDQAIPYQQSLQEFGLPKISVIEVLKNIGHTSMFECPEKLNMILINFCNDVLNPKIT